MTLRFNIYLKLAARIAICTVLLLDVYSDKSQNIFSAVQKNTILYNV